MKNPKYIQQDANKNLPEVSIPIDNSLDAMVWKYCASRNFPIPEHIKIVLSSFWAPFAAKAAGKSPERVKAIALYSLRQLSYQQQLIESIFGVKQD
ncbi:hypothetical protein [Microcoleus sp.]|uniref:hypothetical protein n=1 Tax=Microcoleus sp. TaxID=44472 RepID=UPI00352405D6